MSTTSAQLREYISNIINTLTEWSEKGWHDSETNTDFFDDVLDVMYMMGDCGEYRGVQICLAFGGPSVYVNTNTNVVECYWWENYESVRINSNLSKSIDDYFINYFINMKPQA